jgi:hypothetical protein
MVSDSVAGIPPLHPQELVRVTEKNGKRFFGYQHSQRDELIRRGLIPAPFEPYPGAKFSFWTGQQILDHHAARIAAQAALSENETDCRTSSPSRRAASGEENSGR